MNSISITTDKGSPKEETMDMVTSGGYLLLYMDENDKIKMIGKLDMKALTPMLTKIVLEKLTR